MIASLLGMALALQAPNIVITEVAHTFGPSSEPFGTIGGMLVVGRDTVIIADDVQESLHRWVVSSGRVNVFARSGKGPGEVLTPVSLARRPQGGFAVYDVAHAGVLFYGPHQEFESKALLKGGFVSNPKSLAILSDGSFVVSGGRMRDPRQLHRYSPSGEWIESFGEPSPGIVSSLAKVQAAGGALRTSRDGLFFSAGAPLRIVRFPSARLDSPAVMVHDRVLLPELTEENLHGPPEPEAGGLRPFLWWHDRSTGVFVFTGDRILNVVTRYYRGDSVWDLYASDGKRIARTVVPRAYSAWDVTQDGHILASYRRPDTDESVATLLRIEIK